MLATQICPALLISILASIGYLAELPSGKPWYLHDAKGKLLTFAGLWDRWEGGAEVTFVTPESRPYFNDFLRRLMEEYRKESCTVTLTKGGNTPVVA